MIRYAAVPSRALRVKQDDPQLFRRVHGAGSPVSRPIESADAEQSRPHYPHPRRVALHNHNLILFTWNNPVKH